MRGSIKDIRARRRRRTSGMEISRSPLITFYSSADPSLEDMIEAIVIKPNSTCNTSLQEDLVSRKGERYKSNGANSFSINRTEKSNQNESERALELQSIANKIAVARPKRLLVPLSPDERDAALKNTPKPRLHMLLPDAMPTTNAFYNELERYRESRAKLESIKKQAKEEREEKKSRRILEEKQVAMRLRHSNILEQSLLRLKHRALCTTFLAWCRHTKQRIRARSMCLRILQNRTKELFLRWKHAQQDAELERECSALAIQCAVRRKFAYNALRQAQREWHASAVINQACRAWLARNVLKLARRQAREHERVVKLSLERLSGNAVARCFHAWADRVALMRKVRRMAGNLDSQLLSDTLVIWRKNARVHRKIRRKRATALLQRVARGYLGRKVAREARRLKNAAVKIQCVFRIKRSQRIVHQKLHQRRMVLLKTKRMMAGTIHNTFYRWKTHFRQRKAARVMMGKCNHQRVHDLFYRWKVRKPSAQLLQRVFRGSLGRRRANKAKLDRIMLNLNQEKKNEEESQDPLVKYNRIFEFIQLNKNQSNPCDSDELQRIEKELTVVIQTNNEYYDLALHGSKQRFILSKHRDFLVSMLEQDYKKELARIKEDLENANIQKQQLIENWKEMMKAYLGEGLVARLGDYETYANAGKSFKLRLEAKADVKDTLKRWKNMFEVGLVTRWTLLTWIAEGMLLENNVQADKRDMIWKVIQKRFERDFLIDLAALIVKRIEDGALST